VGVADHHLLARLSVAETKAYCSWSFGVTWLAETSHPGKLWQMNS
jgi:hypothetical protein